MSTIAPSPKPSAVEVRKEIRTRILDALHDRARCIFLHGSRVQGTARPTSDWDVVVVLRDPVIDWVEEGLRLSALFYASAFAVDLQVFSDEEFALDTMVPGTLPYAIARRGELLA